MADKPTYVYVTYIQSTPERVWEALTDADLTAAVLGSRATSRTGSPAPSGSTGAVDGSGIADVVGTVLEADPPTRLGRPSTARTRSARKGRRG